MSRFFVDPALLRLDETDSRHALRVLRLGVGDRLTLCDGAGHEAEAEITQVAKEVELRLLTDWQKADGVEMSVAVTLFQGVCKGERMDYCVQKATELGAFRIVPVIMARCVAEGAGKAVRWQRIAHEAAKQSGRVLLPQVCAPMDFAQARDMAANEMCVVAWEEETRVGLKQILQAGKPERLSIWVGPEGGLEKSEVEQLKASGAVTVTLGRRILRTETAGPALLAMVGYEYE